MSRKSFLVLTLLVVVIDTSLAILSSILKIPLLNFLSLFLVGIYLLFVSYLFLIKKSINLLSGMTDEQALKIAKNEELTKKYTKVANLVGLILILSAATIIIIALTIL